MPEVRWESNAAGCFCSLLVDMHWRSYNGDDIGAFPNTFLDLHHPRWGSHTTKRLHPLDGSILARGRISSALAPRQVLSKSNSRGPNLMRAVHRLQCAVATSDSISLAAGNTVAR